MKVTVDCVQYLPSSLRHPGFAARLQLYCDILVIFFIIQQHFLTIALFSVPSNLSQVLQVVTSQPYHNNSGEMTSCRKKYAVAKLC